MFTKEALFKARVSITIILCGIIVFWSIQALGEEWTETQKEVLSAIDALWEKRKQADLKGLETMIHDDAIMWRPDNAFPAEKEMIISHDSRWLSYDPARPVTSEIVPYAVQIFGDIANVLYSYKWEGKDKKRFSGHSQALVTFKKQNGRWLIISALSSSCEKLPKCLD